MEKNKLIKNFQIVSYAIGGIFFLIIGIRGFVQIASTEGAPSIGLFVFTVLFGSFGVWSIRSFLGNFRNVS
ncbi:MAG: hypothetical protein Q7J35_00445 [Candidatus Methanoperedens sp.]|nr:hypothetical protein [Candidatus Methanoperedens sp.]